MRPTILLALWCTLSLGGEFRALVGWEFATAGDAQGWQPSGSHMADVRVADGCISARVVDWDPFLTSPVFDIPARHTQWVETRVRATHSGDAEFFWTNTLKTRYAGFSPGKETRFRIVGDGQWHVYRVRCFWAPEKRIIRLRFDLPRDKGTYEIDYVRIMQAAGADAPVEPVWGFERDAEGWGHEEAGKPLAVEDGCLVVPPGRVASRLVGPAVAIRAAEKPFLSIRMAVNKGNAATVGFANDADSGWHTQQLALCPDGRPHWYLVDMSGNATWRSVVRLLTLEPSDAAGAEARIDSMRIGSAPAGAAELLARGFGIADGLPRAGQRLALATTLTNRGAGVARDVRFRLELPDGLALGKPTQGSLGDLWYGETRVVEWPVRAEAPVQGKAKLTVSATGIPPLTAEAAVDIGPTLALPRAHAVPEPKPARTDYQVGAYYFPGFPTWAKWRPIADFPERKPLLGWYDESLPEVADWQIKWAVEHGVSFFAVDWYWCQGARHLEHWLHDAYFKARYRRYLKFCLLWANHNPPGTSSEADLLAVTDYWVEHYFHRPEYLKVDGKPVVIIFSTHRLTQDLGSKALGVAFGKMQERCKAAGLKGIYLVACTGSSRGTIERLKAEGYSAISGYNYASLGSGNRLWAPYSALIDGYRELWNTAADHRILKEIPALSGGWDSRPWHGPGARVRHDRTPELFERHCREAKAFLDRRDGEMPPPLKMCIAEAWNEWGEGSYIGPHREHGFGYLEAIRTVFAPNSPKPQPLTPRDVGLGPYDCPRPDWAAPRTAWDLTRAEHRSDWRIGAQATPDASRPGLAGTSTGNDPIIGGPVVRIAAETFPWLCIEMSTTVPTTVQLFWAATTGPVSEGRSVRFQSVGNKALQTHWVRLSDVASWGGLVTGLRLDPASATGVGFEVRAIRFARQRP